MTDSTEQQRFNNFQQQLQTIVEEVFTGNRDLPRPAEYKTLVEIPYHKEHELYSRILGWADYLEGERNLPEFSGNRQKIIDNIVGYINRGMQIVPNAEEMRRVINMAEYSEAYSNYLLIHTDETSRLITSFIQGSLPKSVQQRNQREARDKLEKIVSMQLTAENLPEMLEKVHDVRRNYLYSIPIIPHTTLSNWSYGSSKM